MSTTCSLEEFKLIYQWIVTLCPSLADQLTSIHRKEGEEALAHKFPELAPIVNHIVGFVRYHRDQQALATDAKAKEKADKIALAKAQRVAERAKAKAALQEKSHPAKRGRPRKRKVGQCAEPDPVESDVDEPQQHSPDPFPGDPLPQMQDHEICHDQPFNWSRMPTDLFGFLPPTKSTIILEAMGPPIPLQSLGGESHLKADDERAPTSRPFMETVRDRCIMRGTILQCLVDAFGAGIFDTHSMKAFLRRPCRIFSGGLNRDKAFARSVQKDERKTLVSLDACLVVGFLVKDPNLAELCTRLGELVHRGLLSLKLGKVLSDEEYDNPHELLRATPAFLRLVTASATGKKRARRTLAEVKPTVDILLPSHPSFRIAAIIIREALAQHCKKEATNETAVYRKMLEGRHPTTGALTQRDPDQMDPIGADLQGFRLLQTVLPSSEWTTKTGFSSLLVFMGTGQGTTTSEFLARMQQRETKMHFSLAQACIQLFSLIDAGRPALDPAIRIKYENAVIYGQANSWYTTHPSIRVDAVHTRRLSLANKFEPFFADEIQRSWIAFLGPLTDQDEPNEGYGQNRPHGRGPKNPWRAQVDSRSKPHRSHPVPFSFMLGIPHLSISQHN
ncbi:hypothetical protein DFH09DRAFT_1090917 [Mycena vulgaris]|nr:hypothetical protein DFH09DRAFT_1090917 [Mycena vulgaris]